MDFDFGIFPNRQDFLVFLVFRKKSFCPLAFDFGFFLSSFRDNFRLRFRDHDIVDTPADTRLRYVLVTEGLDHVENLRSLVDAVFGDDIINEFRKPLLSHLFIDEWEIFRKAGVEHKPADSRVKKLAFVFGIARSIGWQDFDLGAERNCSVVVGCHGFVRTREIFAFALFTLDRLCHPISTEHDIHTRVDDRVSVLRLKKILVRSHKVASFGLSSISKRQVNGHLVSVEVSVECRTHQWVNLDSLTFDEDRVESLDTESVKSWCAV